MKKLAPSIVFLLALSFAAVPVGAQTRGRCATNSRTNYGSRYDQGRVYNQRVYRDSGYRSNVYSGSRYESDGDWNRDRSVWERSRDKITTGIGAGAGTVVGSAIGGKKGAIIGAIAGGGGAALYTYVLRNKNRRRY